MLLPEDEIRSVEELDAIRGAVSQPDLPRFASLSSAETGRKVRFSRLFSSRCWALTLFA